MTYALFKNLLLLVSLGLITRSNVVAQKGADGQVNPLVYRFNQPTDFARIRAEHVGPATRRAIAEAKKQLAGLYTVPDSRRTFDNTLRALDNAVNELFYMGVRLSILKRNSPTKALRDSAYAGVETIDKFNTEIRLDEPLYQAVKAYAQTREAGALTGYKRRFLTKTVQNFERQGFALTAEKRAELKAHFNRESELAYAFYKNLTEYKDSLIVSEADMAGLPDDYRQVRRLPDGRYRIGLDDPSYQAFLEMAESEPARKALFLKFKRRAGDQNRQVLRQILIERKRIATLLGYRSYAQYAMVDRMAKTPQTVWAFIDTLNSRAQPTVKTELDTLLAVKRRYLSNDTIQQLNEWDQRFFTRQLVKARYDIDQDKLKDYFSFDQVVNSLFMLTKTLFGVSVEEVKNPSVWHPSVRLFRFTEGGKSIGLFYLDPYVRPDKNASGAYMMPLTFGKQTAQGYQQPATAIVCNFNPPTAEKPTLLRHREVETLYHEYGHLLHNALTKANLMTQSGTLVATDFVETPSQLFENWAWSYEVLKQFARHYQTGEVLPIDLHRKMLATRKVNPSLWVAWGTYEDILDMTLHDQYDPEGSKTTTDVVRELQNKMYPFGYTEGTVPEASFTHLVGYDAGYYSYDWSLVYAQDFFSVFEKEGVLNPTTGMRYRRMILEKGDTEDPAKLVRDFLGRGSNQDAFLRWLGLPASQKAGRLSGSR